MERSGIKNSGGAVTGTNPAAVITSARVGDGAGGKKLPGNGLRGFGATGLPRGDARNCEIDPQPARHGEAVAVQCFDCGGGHAATEGVRGRRTSDARYASASAGNVTPIL
jgi:hypothetical protein